MIRMDAACEERTSELNTSKIMENVSENEKVKEIVESEKSSVPNETVNDAKMTVENAEKNISETSDDKKEVVHEKDNFTINESYTKDLNSDYLALTREVDEMCTEDKDKYCSDKFLLNEDVPMFNIEEDKINSSLQEEPSFTSDDDFDSLNGHKDKTEEQLIADVQIFYPEIEFSKTVSNLIQEGQAYIIKQSQNVFYNPVQEFNRDLSVLAISVFSEEHWKDPRCRSRSRKRKGNDGEKKECNDDDSTENSLEKRRPGVKYDDGITILEALSATGLRSIRYAKEVPGVKEIVANDIAVAAVESIKQNIEYNSVADLVTTSHNDAALLMYMRKAQGNFFDVVDLDPYGCPSRFLDSAVQCVRDGGLLLITCTDMAVLAGNSPETCYVKYGAISLRNSACHEMALRIVLQCVESHANRYGRYIVPQLSFSADFYVRVIVKVYTSPSMCKKTTSKLVMLYQCVGCQSFSSWPLGLTENCNKAVKYHLSRGPPVSEECPHCASSYYQGGPIWSGPLHNTTFIEQMLSQMGEYDLVTEKRIEGMLELIKEELPGVLLYHTIDSLCSKVHCEVVPRNKFVSAILHAGYKVTLSHAAPNSVKTNAPSGVIWDIIRCWVLEHPVNPKRLNKGSIAEKLLSAMPRLRANFDLHPEVMPRSRKKLLRYQQNPQPFWGPGTRDKNNYQTDDKMSKSIINQNKKFKRARIERDKAHMKAQINSKNIDIIEVVTLSDDDDDVKDSNVVNDSKVIGESNSMESEIDRNRNKFESSGKEKNEDVPTGDNGMDNKDLKSNVEDKNDENTNSNKEDVLEDLEKSISMNDDVEGKSQDPMSEDKLGEENSSKEIICEEMSKFAEKNIENSIKDIDSGNPATVNSNNENSEKSILETDSKNENLNDGGNSENFEKPNRETDSKSENLNNDGNSGSFEKTNPDKDLECGNLDEDGNNSGSEEQTSTKEM